MMNSSIFAVSTERTMSWASAAVYFLLELTRRKQTLVTACSTKLFLMLANNLPWMSDPSSSFLGGLVHVYTLYASEVSNRHSTQQAESWQSIYPRVYLNFSKW
jgi:hypothetical protein